MSGFAGWVRARWQDFVRAIRLAPVRLGLLGTVLLVVGSLSPAYLPQASPYWPVMRALSPGFMVSIETPILRHSRAPPRLGKPNRPAASMTAGCSSLR